MLASEKGLFDELGLEFEEMLKFLIDAAISLVDTTGAGKKMWDWIQINN